MKPTRNKSLIVDFFYRNWLFLCALAGLSALSTPSPASISHSPPATTSICSQLTASFRFDFALNQHIRTHGTLPHLYTHYLVARHHLLRFRLPKSTPELTREEVANQTLLDAIDYDIGFSLWDAEADYATKLCFLKYRPGTVSCLQVDQYGHRPLSDPHSIKDLLPRQKFQLPVDFLPTVAFQDVRFTEPVVLPSSFGQPTTSPMQSAIIFVEQTLEPNSGISNASQFKFRRRIEVYSFEWLKDEYLRVGNLTDSAQLPDYLERVPDSLELTGVFNWRTDRTAKHEYLLLAFNGSHHLYCINEDCAQADRYLPYLEACRPAADVVPRDGYVWAINHHPKYEQRPDGAHSIIDVITSEGLQSKRGPFSMYLLSGMFFLVLCLLALILGVCYYSVQEVRLQERQVKKVVEGSVLLRQLAEVEMHSAVSTRPGEVAPAESVQGSPESTRKAVLDTAVVLDGTTTSPGLSSAV